MHTLVFDHQSEPGDCAHDRLRSAVRDLRCPLDDRADVLVRVKRAPGAPIRFFPFSVRHFRVVRDPVVGVVFVDVRVHPFSVPYHRLMILGARKRGEHEEFENVDWQFTLDDLDVAQDRFFRVCRESDDIASVGNRAVGAPLLQHGAVFGDLVLALLGRDQILGIDILKPDEHATHTRARCLLDEVWNFVTERVDLDREAAVNAFLFPKFDDAVEKDFPVVVAGEIIVRDEKPVDALRCVLADDLFEIVGGAKATLVPLHIDDGAKRALIRAATTEVNRGIGTCRAFDMLARQEGLGRPFERG
ncbi:hypothetical protein AWB78_08629 [Caballeronia calidae]|uniref:Uncharacterized protein n=1 Tax=Caballeronia calidae TaxID=1777139 RepID=A0A158EL85_9BURK|nr:hypothetical protein AWB78_08629 [Caballeronia calidae]